MWPERQRARHRGNRYRHTHRASPTWNLHRRLESTGHHWRGGCGGESPRVELQWLRARSGAWISSNWASLQTGPHRRL